MTTKLNPTRAAEFLRAALAADVPVMLWGPPGIGKSAIVAEAAQAAEMPLQDIRLASLEPADLTGLPWRDAATGRTVWSRPSLLPETPAIMFLDEITAAPRAMQAIAYQVALDRRVGEHRLHPESRIIAAGNRTTDRAIAERMSSALANRLAHVEIVPDVRDWCRWALSAGIDARLVAFHSWRGGAALHAMPADLGSDPAYPTPRSWHMVARLLAAGRDDHPAISSCVGDGAAAEFVGFLRLAAQLPDPADCIARPDTAPVPEAPDACYALACAIGQRTTTTNADGALTYLLRLPSAEYAVLGADIALTSQPDDARRAAIRLSRGYQVFALDPRIQAANGLID